MIKRTKGWAENVALIALVLGAIAWFCWAVISSVSGIIYALETGDALGGLLKPMGLPILVACAYMYLLKKVSAHMDKAEAQAPECS